MSYEVTATRKRPKTFDDLTGQEFVVATLKKSLDAGRIAHAYLFSGSRGVGKTSAARILAKALNCEKGPTSQPCGICSNCKEIAKGSNLDVIEIDGASNTSVNDVREIRDEVLFAPNSSKYKVYIIDEVHMLSNSAFNALLKTIEEPPPYVVFIFATTEIHKVPATIRSRCQQFYFRLIDIDLIKTLLASAATDLKVQADDEALYWVAKEAMGSLRDAYTLFDQVAAFSDEHITLEKIREKLGLVGLDQMNALAEAMVSGSQKDVLEMCDQIMTSGVPVEQFIIDLAEYFRGLLLLKNKISREALIGYSPERYSHLVRDTWSSEQLERALESLLALFRNVRYSLNQRFELELVLSRFCQLTFYVTPSQVIERIEEIKEGLFELGSGHNEKKNS